MTDVTEHHGTVIRVKVLSKSPEHEWLRQLPGNQPYWHNCHFLFDCDERDYDWLVVYNDLPASAGERFSVSEETLACPKQHTLLTTTEPSSIKTYGRGYTAQFGYVLTSQEPWALPHPHRIYSQPALHWFYGLGSNHRLAYDTMLSAPPPEKTKLISTVCSNKQQRHTMHNLRYQFTQELKKLLPELDIYGHGVKEMDDKAESLENYRYHVAIENHVGPHHWTEKLSDSFLGYTLPFYFGCPNASDYFPENSFIPIDINDLQGSYNTIRQAIDDNEYEKRLPHIIEARRRVLEQYNFFAVVHDIINSHHKPAAKPSGQHLLSRRAYRKQHPLHALRDASDKIRSRIKHRFRT